MYTQTIQEKKGFIQISKRIAGNKIYMQNYEMLFGPLHDLTTNFNGLIQLLAEQLIIQYSIKGLHG